MRDRDVSGEDPRPQDPRPQDPHPQEPGQDDLHLPAPEPRDPRQHNSNPATPSGPDATLNGRDTDEIWAEIVASFDESPRDGLPPWPADEDIAPEPSDAQGGLARSSPSEAYFTDADEPGGLPLAERGRVREPAEAEGHFIPPPPPPLPHGDAVSRAAWAAVLGGPIYLLIAAIAGFYIPTWLGFLAVGGFVGGFVTLIWRLKGHDPDDPDNGAVV